MWRRSGQSSLSVLGRFPTPHSPIAEKPFWFPPMRPTDSIVAGAGESVDHCFWPVTCRHEQRGGADQPLRRALTHDIPSAGPRGPEATRVLVAAPLPPRVRSRSCEDRHYLRCAIPRKLPQKDFQAKHPGPESRLTKGRGYFAGTGTRTRSSLIGVKGQEAVRQIDFCDWGWGIWAGSGRYNRHLSFHRHPSRLPCARAHAGPALMRLQP